MLLSVGCRKPPDPPSSVSISSSNISGTKCAVNTSIGEISWDFGEAGWGECFVTDDEDERTVSISCDHKDGRELIVIVGPKIFYSSEEMVRHWGAKVIDTLKSGRYEFKVLRYPLGNICIREDVYKVAIAPSGPDPGKVATKWERSIPWGIMKTFRWKDTRFSRPTK